MNDSKYNQSDIGNRIRTLRKKTGLSQDELIDILKRIYEVNVGRNTISAIENGNTSHCELSLLIAFCKIFNCDAGHLLCEYKEKTEGEKQAAEFTGLTPEAVRNLNMLSDPKMNSQRYIDFISELLVSPKFAKIMTDFFISVDAKSAETDEEKSFLDTIKDKSIDPADMLYYTARSDLAAFFDDMRRKALKK